MGQTDGQTDNGHQCIMRPPYGGGGITINRQTQRTILLSA